MISPNLPMNITGSNRANRHPSEAEDKIAVTERIISANPTDDREKIVEIVQFLADKTVEALKADQTQHDRFARSLQISNRTHQGVQHLEVKLPYDCFSWNDMDENDIQLEILRRIVDSQFKWWQSQVIVGKFMSGSTRRYLDEIDLQHDCTPIQNNGHSGVDIKFQQTSDPAKSFNESNCHQTHPVAGHSKQIPRLSSASPPKPNLKVKIQSPVRIPPPILKENTNDETNSTPFTSLRQQHLMRHNRLEKRLAQPKLQAKQISSELTTNYLMTKPTRTNGSVKSREIEIVERDDNDDDDDDDIQIVYIKHCQKQKSDTPTNHQKATRSERTKHSSHSLPAV